MKYTGMNVAYVGLGIVFIVFSVLCTFLFCLRHDVPNDLDITTIVTMSLPFGFGLFLLCRALRRSRKSYTMIQEDGLHIFSRKKEELTFIPWESVKACKLVNAEGRFAYLMLIFQYNAKYAKHPVALYKEGLRPTYKEVWQHRLDECTDKLARGKLTEEEFKQIPYLLLAPSNGRLFEHCLKMWKAKTRTEKKTEADSLS